MHPIDTLRAKLDMLRIPKNRQNKRGPLRMLLQEARSTLSSSGIRGLYGGYGVAVVGSTPANAMYFAGYHFWRRKLGRERVENSEEKLQWWRDMLAGFGAQVFANIYWTPLDVVKQRMQVSPVGTHVGAVLRSVVDSHGVLGFWRGYNAGLLVWGPYSGIYFAVFEMMKNTTTGLFHTNGVGPTDEAVGTESVTQALACGMGASMVAAVLTQPLDCVKTRIQVLGGDPSAFRVLQNVLQKEGGQGLWRGAAARVLWLAPGGGITLCVFEAVMGRAVHAAWW